MKLQVAAEEVLRMVSRSRHIMTSCIFPDFSDDTKPVPPDVATEVPLANATSFTISSFSVTLVEGILARRCRGGLH